VQGRWPEVEMTGSRFGGASRRLVLAVVLGLPVVLAATPAQAAPDPTTSYYVRSSGAESATRWYDYGCAQGQRDAVRPGTQNRIVLLDFGTPMLVGGVYGFDLPGGASGEFRSRLQAKPVAVNFAVGYYACTGADRASTISLAVGTTNGGTQVRDNGYQQGRAFANFVKAITSAVAASGVSSQVVVRGAIDVEMDWNTYPDTREWYDGYDSLSNTPLYDFGDAAGCPQTGAGTSCNNGWTQDRVWYVSEGFLLAQPLPEIYTNSGSQARQWYHLARYAALNKPARMLMAGTLTQFAACQQVGGCATTDNTPAEGWTQLYNLLNADPTVRHSPRWSADLSYSS
jgi:hypothetical protein